MPLANGVVSNYHLNLQTAALRAVLNIGHTLRLFKNNFTPTPANVLSDFTQADFVGYAGQSLNGVFAAQTKITDGEYQTQAASQTFAFSSGSAQTVYGWYIDDGVGVRYSYHFDNPVNMTAGVSLVITVQAQDWSYSIVP